MVAVLVDRSGRVKEIMVGDTDRVYLPDIGRQRGGDRRFRGIRLLRTNLRAESGESPELSRDDLADLNQLQLDMVVSIAVGPGGYPGRVTWAHLIPENPEGDLWLTRDAINPSELEQEIEFDHFIAELESDREALEQRLEELRGERSAELKLPSHYQY